MIVKWVCKKCGSNNMQEQSHTMYCSICEEIRTDEVLTEIDLSKVTFEPKEPTKQKRIHWQWLKNIKIIPKKYPNLLSNVVKAIVVIAFVISVGYFLFASPMEVTMWNWYTNLIWNGDDTHIISHFMENFGVIWSHMISMLQSVIQNLFHLIGTKGTDGMESIVNFAYFLREYSSYQLSSCMENFSQNTVYVSQYMYNSLLNFVYQAGYLVVFWQEYIVAFFSNIQVWIQQIVLKYEEII